jgi:hypothetical protein
MSAVRIVLSINYHHRRRHPLRPAGSRRFSGCERHAYPRHFAAVSQRLPQYLDDLTCRSATDGRTHKIRLDDVQNLSRI